MKTLITLLLMVMATPAKADFASGVLLGGLLFGGGSSTTKVVVQDEFAKQVNQIENYLPSRYESSSTPEMRFQVIKEDKDRYLNYFKNGGFQVTYVKGELVFDLSASHQQYLQQQEKRAAEQVEFNAWIEEVKPYFKWAGYLVLVIVFLCALVSAINTMNQTGITRFFLNTMGYLLKQIHSRNK